MQSFTRQHIFWVTRRQSHVFSATMWHLFEFMLPCAGVCGKDAREIRTRVWVSWYASVFLWQTTYVLTWQNGVSVVHSRIADITLKCSIHYHKSGYVDHTCVYDIYGNFVSACAASGFASHMCVLHKGANVSQCTNLFWFGDTCHNTLI